MSAEPEFVPLTVEELQVYFSQYEIQSFIAAGGMGAVYSANQKSIDRQVAIKVLPREMSSDEEFSAQFRAEAKVMSRVNHPNLLGFFDFGEVDGMLFIVMEFVAGKSLHHSAHGEAIDSQVALDLIIGIAEGVNHAHEAGILHRDIKPANVLLDQKATPKLGDFGLARPLEESEEGKVIFGTPGYTAPEVVNNPAAIDERADIFSLGAILYELLTGHLPEEKYAPPSSEVKIHKNFDKIVKKAILPDPDLRYPDMEEFLADLKDLKEKLNSDKKEEEDEPEDVKSSNKALATPGLKSGGAVKSSPKLTRAKASSGGRTEALPTSIATGRRTTPTKYDKAKAEKSKLVNIAIMGAVVAIGAVFIFSKVLKGKKEANQPEQAVVTVDSDAENDAVKVQSVEVVETSFDKLEKVSEKLKSGDFSELPEGSVTSDNRAYFFYDEPKTWMNAQREAGRRGGYLACPSTVALTEQFMEQMELHNCTQVWTGGGTAGDKQMSWIDGKKWHFRSFIPEAYGALAFNSIGDMSIADPGELKQFFICWDLDGKQLGAVKSQLKRIQAAASKGDVSLLPPGAFAHGRSVYYVHNRRAIYKEAQRLAEGYGANVATLKGDKLFQKFSRAVSISLKPDASAWISGDIMKNGSVNWNANLNNEQIWLEQLSPSNSIRGIRIVNKSTPGLMSADKLKGVEAVVWEWRMN